MAWNHIPGNTDCKQFLQHFPFPRALREAMARGEDIIPPSIKALSWCAYSNAPVTIGEALSNLPARQVVQLHDIIIWYARDRERWVSPDGTFTDRWL